MHKSSIISKLIALATMFATLSIARAQPLAIAEEQAFEAAVDAVAPSVVQLRTVGGIDRVGRVSMTGGPTTGVVVSSEGHVLTSAYTTASLPESVIAVTDDGRQSPLRVLATDHSRKLVLLVPQQPLELPVPTFVGTGDIAVGQWAITIGRAYRPDRPNVSLGVVSARYRIGRRAVQTDAAISPANYGGALVDVRGRVLGIITPMSTSEGELAGVEWYDSGIGFAVPLGDMLPALERLKQGEDLYPGKLGVALKKGNPNDTPAEVSEVAPDSGAAKAGIVLGDIITAVDGVAITTQAELKRQIAPRYAGETVKISLQRAKEESSVDVTLLQDVKLATPDKEG